MQKHIAASMHRKSAVVCRSPATVSGVLAALEADCCKHKASFYRQRHEQLLRFVSCTQHGRRCPAVVLIVPCEVLYGSRAGSMQRSSARSAVRRGRCWVVESWSFCPKCCTDDRARSMQRSCGRSAVFFWRLLNLCIKPGVPNPGRRLVRRYLYLNRRKYCAHAPLCFVQFTSKAEPSCVHQAVRCQV